jgi:hypothetical protein
MLKFVFIALKFNREYFLQRYDGGLFGVSLIKGIQVSLIIGIKGIPNNRDGGFYYRTKVLKNQKMLSGYS